MIPSLFTFNGFLVISDGLEARAGTISSGFSRFMAWKSADGKVEASPLVGQLETLIRGMLERKTLLDLLRHFVVFENERRKTGRPVSSLSAPRRRSPPTTNTMPSTAPWRRRCAPRATPQKNRSLRHADGPPVARGLRAQGRRGAARRRPQGRRHLAYAGLGRVPLHGLLYWQGRTGHGQPHDPRHHRPQRPGRPASSTPSPPAGSSSAKSPSRPRAATNSKGS